MPIYMKIDSVNGDVTAEGYKQWIAVHSVQFGVGRAISSAVGGGDRKSTRLNSSNLVISYAVFCLKQKSQSALGVLELLPAEDASGVHGAGEGDRPRHVLERQRYIPGYTFHDTLQQHNKSFPVPSA